MLETGDVEIDKRLGRARARSLDYYVRSSDPDPMVIEVDSHHSGETYTIVPDIAYCSCGDARYRGGPCWHLLYLLDHDDVDSKVREAVIAGVEDRADRMMDRAEERELDAREARERSGAWLAASDVVWPDARDPSRPRAPGVINDTLDSNESQDSSDSVSDPIASTARTADE